MRVLVTGGEGFVGGHVVRRLVAAGAETVAAIRDPYRRGSLGAPELASVRVSTFELSDPTSVDRLIRSTDPDATIHLAGQSSVARSWRDARETVEVNALGALALADALRRHALETGSRRTLLLVGSAEAYGRSAQDGHRLSEEDVLQPLSPYAASKAAQEMIGYALGADGALRVVQTRSFLHTGTGQRPPFVFAEWATALLAARVAGSAGAVTLPVGDLAIERDIGDVRDVADAYVRLIEAPAEGVFNVCTGEKYRLEDALGMLADLVGVRVAPAPALARKRPTDIGCLWGSYERLHRVTGWRPLHSLRDALESLVGELRTLPVSDGPARLRDA